MKLLIKQRIFSWTDSYDIYDENGKEQSTNSSGVTIARKAEKELNSDLKNAIISVLGPMFGNNNVVVQVNADLNFDTNETTEIKIDPNRVALKEDRTTNKNKTRAVTFRRLFFPYKEEYK